MGNVFKKSKEGATTSFEDGDVDDKVPGLPHRVLSGVYDMTLLKGVQELEDKYRERFGDELKCEPDDIPFDFDLMMVAQLQVDERKSKLQEILDGQPFSTEELINEILKGLAAVDEDVKKHNEKKKKLNQKIK